MGKVRWFAVTARAGALSPLKHHLDHLYRTFDRSWLSPDPLEVPHRYTDPDDREIVAFYSSGLAYGRVDGILRSLARLTELMGDHPARFVRDFDFARDRHRFRGFVHRFHGPREMALLTEILRRTLEDYGNLGASFAQGIDAGDDDIGPGLSRFCERMAETGGLPKGPGVRNGRLVPGSPVRLFFSSPANGSACKRLNLFLRWMVRRTGGIDLGLWPQVSPAQLVIPLDTHVARIARYIGLASRTTPDWKMALEVTHSLRRFDPEDPVKYDFAICRLGILDYCPRKRHEVKCAACLLRPVCTL
jgi:uncharacterized protein (TIGR02757 family)